MHAAEQHRPDIAAPAQEQIVEGSAGRQPGKAKDKSEGEQLHCAYKKKTAGGVGKRGLM